jgi:hypothetical protein
MIARIYFKKFKALGLTRAVSGSYLTVFAVFSVGFDQDVLEDALWVDVDNLPVFQNLRRFRHFRRSNLRRRLTFVTILSDENRPNGKLLL